MTNAEVARLSVQLDLTGNFNSALGAAEARLGTFSTTAGTRVAGAVGTLERAAGRMGSALGHAGSQLKNLITGPLGIIGLTGGLLSFGGAIGATLGKLNDLAFGTEKLQALTGDSAQSLSALIAVSDKYGISLDRLTLIAGFYEKNVQKVIASGKTGGAVLVDATGKALPFSQALLNVADAYSKNTDKAAAATAAAALFGRGYTAIVPVLALGKQGIIDLETEAAKMGLVLGQDNIADFAKYRAAVRGSQEAISGLEVAIGEDLLPEITKLADGIRTFVTDHKTDIVSFFHNAIAVAKTVGGALADVGSAAAGFWNSLPPAFRDLLVKGIVADRTFKFLFGFDPIKAGASLLGIGANQFFARGSPANPMWVTSLGGGLPGGPPPGLPIGPTSPNAPRIPLGIGVALGFASQQAITNSDPLQTALQKITNGGTTAWTNIAKAGHLMGDAAKTLGASTGALALATGGLAAIVARDELVHRAANQTVPQILAGILRRSAEAHGGVANKAALDSTFRKDMLVRAQHIVVSGESTAEKLSDLKRIQNDLRIHGDRAAQRKIDRLITAVKNQKLQVHFTAALKMAPNTVYRISSTTYAGSGTTNRPVGSGGDVNI